jgi:hypothetical protein
MKEIILHDDTIIPTKPPVVKMPDPVEKTEEPKAVSIKPSDNKTRDIIILIVLIVLIVGAFMILNVINKKKLAAVAVPTT